jgi:hypothetical protein
MTRAFCVLAWLYTSCPRVPLAGIGDDGVSPVIRVSARALVWPVGVLGEEPALSIEATSLVLMPGQPSTERGAVADLLRIVLREFGEQLRRPKVLCSCPGRRES